MIIIQEIKQFLLLLMVLVAQYSSSQNYNLIFASDDNELAIKQGLDHERWDKLLAKFVSDEGKVDYIGFKKDLEELEAYLTLLSSEGPPTKDWTRKAALSYWINAYNAFTIKLILDNYPVSSIKDISNPWDQKFFKIGGDAYDLNTVEHKILRKMNEPRIHFAIVCASASCPQLLNQAYIQEKLDSQLENVTKLFLLDPKRNQLSYDEIKISKIFSWFKSDFERQGSVQEFIAVHSGSKINPKARIKYLDYDWSLNE